MGTIPAELLWLHLQHKIGEAFNYPLPSPPPSPFAIGINKSLHGPVICPLHITREKAARQFTRVPMIAYAFAADAFPRARLIGTTALCFVLINSALSHNCSSIKFRENTITSCRTVCNNLCPLFCLHTRSLPSFSGAAPVCIFPTQSAGRFLLAGLHQHLYQQGPRARRDP